MDNLKKGGAHLDVKEPNVNDFFEKALEHDFQKLNEPFYIEPGALSVDKDGVPVDGEGVPLGIATANSTTAANKYISINNLFFHILMEALELPDTTIKSIYLASRYGYIFQVNLPENFNYLRNSYLSGGIDLNLNDPLKLLVIKLVVTANDTIQLGTTGKYCMTQASFLKETKNQYDINAETIVTRLSICPDIIDFSLMDKDVAVKFLEKMKEKMESTTKTSDTKTIDEIIGYLNQSDVTGLGFNVMEFANGFETFASFESNRNNAQLIDSVKYLIAANVVWLYTIGWIHLDLHKWNVMVKTGFDATTLTDQNLNTINVWFLDMGSMKSLDDIDKEAAEESAAPEKNNRLTFSRLSTPLDKFFITMSHENYFKLLVATGYSNDYATDMNESNGVWSEYNKNNKGDKRMSLIELFFRISYENLYKQGKPKNGTKNEDATLGKIDYWGVSNKPTNWETNELVRFNTINTVLNELLTILTNLNTKYTELFPIKEFLNKFLNKPAERLIRLDLLKFKNYSLKIPGEEFDEQALGYYILNQIYVMFGDAYNRDDANMKTFGQERNPQMDYLNSVKNFLYNNHGSLQNVSQFVNNMISFLFHRLITRSAVKPNPNHVLYRMPDVPEDVQVQVLDPYLVSDVSELKAATRALNGKINIDSNGKVSVSGDANLDSLNNPIKLLGGNFSLVDETNQPATTAETSPLLEAAAKLLEAATTSSVATI